MGGKGSGRRSGSTNAVAKKKKEDHAKEVPTQQQMGAFFKRSAAQVEAEQVEQAADDARRAAEQAAKDAQRSVDFAQMRAGPTATNAEQRQVSLAEGQGFADSFGEIQRGERRPPDVANWQPAEPPAPTLLEPFTSSLRQPAPSGNGRLQRLRLQAIAMVASLGATGSGASPPGEDQPPGMLFDASTEWLSAPSAAAALEPPVVNSSTRREPKRASDGVAGRHAQARRRRTPDISWNIGAGGLSFSPAPYVCWF